MLPYKPTATRNKGLYEVTAKAVFRHLALSALVSLCVACGSSEEQSGVPVDKDQTTNPLDDPGATGERALEVGADDTTVTEVDRCFCIELYSDTLRIYHFKEQSAVLEMRFDNTSSEFTSTSTVHIFDAASSTASVKQWINNLYSDALFFTAARPISSHALADNAVTVTANAYVETSTGNRGDTYDTYDVEFSVNATTVTNAFSLNGFADSTVVHLQTAAIASE